MAGARNKRTIGAVCAAPILVVLIATPAALGQRAVSSTRQLEQSFLHSINGVRIDHRRPPVRLDRRLSETGLNSPDHRAILLDRRYVLVGVGVSRGEFEGYAETIVVTTDFQEWGAQ